jgi:DNA-directed RNA polymerase specialized sigma24 family protein
MGRHARFLVGDLVQERPTRAIAKIDSRTPGANLRAWLFVFIRNCYSNELKRKNRSPFIDEAGARRRS